MGPGPPPLFGCRSTPTGSSASSKATSKLAEFDWAGYRARYGDIGRLDLILAAEDDSANNYRLSKQADVLMLFYLFSTEELRELLDPMGYSLPYLSGLSETSGRYGCTA